MFGPGVEQAIATYRRAPDDPDLAGLLGLFGSTERVVPLWKRENDWIAGLDENGREFIRVPLLEPVYIGEAFDAKYQVVRTNCP
jgi:nitrate reductase beta subunit